MRDSRTRNYPLCIEELTAHERQEEQTDSSDLFQYRPLWILIDKQFVDRCDLHVLHFIIQRSVAMGRKLKQGLFDTHAKLFHVFETMATQFQQRRSL